MKSAYDSVRDSYDLVTLREIAEHGCVSGVAHDHIYYHETISFFDNYEDEIIEFITDTLGEEFNEELWSNNPCDITGYKNDTVWCYVELAAQQLIEEIESITQEELSDLPDSVYSELKELANTEWGKDHLELVIG